MQVEGEVFKTCEARLPAGCAPARCKFVQGDACALDVPALRALTPGARGFALVHAANLLCRLPEPRAFLRSLPALLAPGGLAVFFSPYSWLAQYTPQDKWLGGAAGARSADVLAAEMQALGFERVAHEDVPFLIREHARKFQYGVAHATAWRMKK
jgi:SAM-dependent methyltransferase